MEELRALFIKYLTEDTDPKCATAIFDKENGLPLWSDVKLDMIMQAFDKVIKESC